MEILQAPSPNYTKWRAGRVPIAIVNHITAGLFPGCLTWMQNPGSKASSHYLITKRGLIYQLVQDEDTAYTSGFARNPTWSLYDGSNPNYYTLNIEHEDLGPEPTTEEQYQATLWLHKQLIAKWGVPIDSEHIIGHNRIDTINRANDPGNFPWDRLFADLLKGANDMPEGAQAAKIIVGGKEYPAYIKGGHVYFGQGVPVHEFMQAVPRTLDWNSEKMTLFIK